MKTNGLGYIVQVRKMIQGHKNYQNGHLHGFNKMKRTIKNIVYLIFKMPNWSEAYNPNIKTAYSRGANDIKRAVFSREELVPSTKIGGQYKQFSLKDFGAFAESSVGRYSVYRIERIEVDIIPGRQAFNLTVPWYGYFAADTSRPLVAMDADKLLSDADVQIVNMLNSDVITISWEPAIEMGVQYPLEGKDGWVNKSRTDVLYNGLKYYTDTVPDSTLTWTMNQRIYVAMKQTPE